MRRSLYSLPAQRAGSARPVHLPPPVGGINTRDPLSAMKGSDAIDMVNWFPLSEELVMRGGSAAYTTGGLGAGITSLLSYQRAGGAGRLFAVTSEGIYDVSNGGAVGALAASVTLTGGDVQAVNFQNSIGTSYLWAACPGLGVALYDGSAWATLTDASTPAITGVTPGALRAPWVFKRRIFAIEAGTMNAWCLAVDSIAGAVEQIPLGPLFSLGGDLVAGGTWSLDGGAGLDDYCVFITSRGEVAVYQGSNPSDANDWSLVGVYFVGEPVGSRPFFKFGADLGIMTINGVFPISQALKGAGVNDVSTMTQKIDRTWRQYVEGFRDRTGWGAWLIPERSALIVNVPIQAHTHSRQLVMNTATGAWTKFDGWDAYTFVQHGRALYYGGIDGNVYRAWDNDLLNDAGTAIEATVQTAFGYFGYHPGRAAVGLWRPHLRVDGAATLAWGVAEDYRPGDFTDSVALDSDALDWDVAPWDTSSWGDTAQYVRQWRTVTAGAAEAHSLLLKATTGTARVAWTGTDYTVQRGGMV